jgi:hypothetical protein
VTGAVPLPGPIEELPLSAVTDVQARAMLGQALAGVELGGFDREALEYLADRDTRVTTVVASLLRRAWAAGVEDGKSERLDEVVAVATARHDLRVLRDRVLSLVDQADAALADEHADRQPVAELLIANVRAAVAGDDPATADRLRKVVERFTASYARLLAKDPDGIGRRDLVVAVLMDSAVVGSDGDAELAAAVRAIYAADRAEEETRKQRTTETPRAAAAPPPVAASAGDDPADVVDQDHEHDRWWCRVCDEQPTDDDDGICTTCRADIAEGRRTDPNATGGAS